MSDLKIAVLGAGSYVFGPSILSQVILEHQLNGVELALMDIDFDMLELIAQVGRRMVAETGVQVTITTHTTRPTALDGAAFVISAVSREMHRRFIMDVEIIQTHTPGHLISEFGGVAGISYSLRQIALALEITDDIRRYCPNAWYLTVSNPLPRVCQATRENGVKTIGFCSVSLVAYNMISQIKGHGALAYPFTAARNTWTVKIAGLNHFAWLLELYERETGTNQLDSLPQHLDQGVTSRNPISEDLCQKTGYLLTAGDEHVKDFLPPRPSTRSIPATWHGTTREQQARIGILREIIAGNLSWDVLFESVSWERPVDLIAAMVFNEPVHFHALNLINDGQITNLPRNIFVETACLVTGDGIAAQETTLPAAILAYCQRTAQVTDRIVQAALRQSRALVYESVELDPTILSKAAGIQAIDACLDAHADILPDYC